MKPYDLKNCVIRPLTPSEFDQLDPSRTLTSKFVSGVDDSFSPQSRTSREFGNRQDWASDFTQFVSRLFRQRPVELKRELKALQKFGAQGGTTSLENILEIVQEYYTLPTILSLDILIRGRDYLVARIVDKRRDIPFEVALTKYYDTQAGVPTGRHKGTFQAETVCVNKSRIQHPLPSVLGMRRMKGSVRAIFMDATRNVRQTEGVILGAQSWLRKEFPEYFGAWLNPAIVERPLITQMVDTNAMVIGLDYRKCDQHFSQELFNEIVLPVLEAIADPGDYFHVAPILSEYFMVPLLVGPYLIMGKHTLFSGQTITQFAETVVDICLQIGTVLTVGGLPLLKKARHLAIGDDQVLAILGKTDPGLQTEVLNTAVAASTAAGLPMNVEKCKTAIGEVEFCKRLYRRGYPRTGGILQGYYPYAYALNSVVNPESASSTLGQEVVAQLQRLDNVVGGPIWTEFIQYMGKRLTLVPEFTSVDVARVSEKDWWARVYGEVWNPESSTAYRVLRQQHLL